MSPQHMCHHVSIRMSLLASNSPRSPTPCCEPAMGRLKRVEPWRFCRYPTHHNRSQCLGRVCSKPGKRLGSAKCTPPDLANHLCSVKHTEHILRCFRHISGTWPDMSDVHQRWCNNLSFNNKDVWSLTSNDLAS